MKFAQKYSYREDGIGWQTVCFVVSDNYDELYEPFDPEKLVDIYQLESVKMDLNTDEGSFAIDELSFTISQASVVDEEQENAMFFCLDAADLLVNRYCALYFSNEPEIENLLFIGKIEAKISGSDLKWNSLEYGYEIDPLREYKFTALSFDVKILEEAKLSGDVYKVVENENIRIDNITERWKANDLAHLKDIFKHRLFYWKEQPVGQEYSFFRPLGNLYNIISKYLLLSSELISEQKNISLSFDLLESDLGFSVNPITFSIAENDIIHPHFKTEKWGYAYSARYKWTARYGLASPVQLKLSPIDLDASVVSPFVNYKMIDPTISLDGYSADEKKEIEAEGSNATQHSFLQNGNVAELLYNIARSLACYIFIRYTTGNTLEIEFKSRIGLVESDFTYIEGVTDADFDTSSIIIDKENEYYCTSSNYTGDVFDILYYEMNLRGETPVINVTKLLEKEIEARNVNSKKGQIKYDRLLFSCSLVIERKNFYEDGYTTEFGPLSTANGKTSTESFVGNNVNYGWSLHGHNRVVFPIDKFLHNGLYVPLPNAPEEQVRTQLGSSTRVTRPVFGVLAKVNNSNRFFNSLADYVNEIMARDKQYYETEYTLTIPFWNAFSKNSDGSEPSWKNIKLGSKIKLSEIVKRYIDNEWISQRVERNYVVVGIERSLSKPETKLKLHNLERFAFGYWDGNANDIPIIEHSSPLTAQVDSKYLHYYVCGENISKGCAVMISNEGKIVRSVANSLHFGKTIGILIEDGIEGESALVQLYGRVQLDVLNFTNLTENQVFVRTMPNTALNISETLLKAKNEDEDMIIIIGKKESANSFTIGITELIWK